ncbi:MAG: hypothetical protein R3F56_13175 [Planctomycetota bacterium]
MMRTFALLSLAGLAASLGAQPNIRPGTDVTNTLGSIASPSPTSGGRIGAFPNGEQAWGITTTSCNVGTINVPWLRDMNVDHPQIGMWMYREYNGRFEQISEFTGVKHGFTSTNSPGCGNCPGGAGTSLVIGCTDTYGASLNYSHTYMAPPSEINPWTGMWTSRGSHFDRGFPPVSPPQDTDNIRSSISFPGTSTGYRNLVWDAGLNVTGASFWVSAYYNVVGEPDANRENNFATQRFTTSWSGTQWSFSTAGGHTQRPAIYMWTGATVTHANNNNGADGRFYVGVKVTGPTAGMYHYEYALFNRDNNGQGASFRVPVCTTATVTNASFRDTDMTPTNDWTVSRSGYELVFTAPAGNSLSWGNLYNFSFDCDMAPSDGVVSIDEATIGSGASPAVHVAASCPLNTRNVNLGAGCGTPTPPALAGVGVATIGNSSFSLKTTAVAANSANVFLLSANAVNVPIGSCRVFVDPTQILLVAGTAANATGEATLPLPVPNDGSLNGAALAVQSVEVQAGGAYQGQADFSNGLSVKLGSCN